MALPPLNDTIAAIATASGSAAVGIVRLSGKNAFGIASHLFKPHNEHNVRTLQGGRVIYGSVVHEGELIDEALLLSFRAPKSYTAEDIIELQSHGGTAVLKRIQSVCVMLGARLAKPGEFTLRAYLNGRLDLIQAESVLNIVNAQSDGARRNAALGLSKALSDELALIQADVTSVYGDIQAVFDYPEEGVPEANFEEPLQRAVKRIDGLLATAKGGQLVQQGAKLALIGKPNAGKSSLLNALLGYGRSIVSDIPGTTRDYLEAQLSIGDIPITAIDTAGIRVTDDSIEALGVQAAKDIAAHADLSLVLIDASEAPSEEDLALLKSLDLERSLIVASKVDLGQVWHKEVLQGALPEVETFSVYPVSVTKGTGLKALRQATEAKLLGDAANAELWLSSERQVEALQKTRLLLEQALTAPDDLAALDLEEALRVLAELTGRGDIAEETLEHIFAKFCVGK